MFIHRLGDLEYPGFFVGSVTSTCSTRTHLVAFHPLSVFSAEYCTVLPSLSTRKPSPCTTEKCTKISWPSGPVMNPKPLRGSNHLTLPSTPSSRSEPPRSVLITHPQKKNWARNKPSPSYQVCQFRQGVRRDFGRRKPELGRGKSTIFSENGKDARCHTQCGEPNHSLRAIR